MIFSILEARHLALSQTIFYGRAVPERNGWLADYSALIHTYDLKVPLPEKLSFISAQHRRYGNDEWEVYTLRYKPEDSLGAHLTFALKYEGVDLAVLNALFKKIPPQVLENWGRAIAQAGLYPLTIEELLRLQKIVIEDSRFVPLGLRQEGGFIGVHERATQMPLPDHISARWQDVPPLIEGMIGAYNRLRQGSETDPVILAAMIAFGFVFIHPFTDGNGRVHRYLIHHILADLDFTPKGIVFPVSAVILERINTYRRILESYSRPRLEFIDWRPTAEGNVEVVNDTIDLYRYFDATKIAEFLYECVLETIDIDKVLPEEIRYLEYYDQMKKAINELFDMPDHLADLLIRFLEQNEGKLSKIGREKEFHSLTDKEVAQLEEIYKSIFFAH